MSDEKTTPKDGNNDLSPKEQLVAQILSQMPPGSLVKIGNDVYTAQFQLTDERREWIKKHVKITVNGQVISADE